MACHRSSESPDRIGNAPGLEFSVVSRCPNLTRAEYISAARLNGNPLGRLSLPHLVKCRTNKIWYNSRVRNQRARSTPMYAVEFQAQVKDDGSIDIPAAYRPQVQGRVRVIILTDPPTTKPSIIRHLLNNPRRVAPFTPF